MNHNKKATEQLKQSTRKNKTMIAEPEANDANILKRQKHSLADVFEKEGTSIVVGGNTPFLLDDKESVWYIHSGKIEVFSVQVEDGKPAGQRNHFFSAIPGHALFGMDLENYGLGLGLLAVGIHKTKLYRMKINKLKALLKHTDTSAEVCSIINHWVKGLSLGLSKNIDLRTDELLEVGSDIVLEDGKRVRAKKDVLWLQYSSGSPLFLGMEKLPINSSDILFPISHRSWLQMSGDTEITAIDTKTAITQLASWNGLEVFYDLLFKCEFFNTRLMAVDEFNLSKQKSAFDKRMGQQAINQLASVLNDGQTIVTAGEQIEDPLLSACNAVGNAMGIAIKSPPKQKDGNKSTEPLYEIIRSSKIQLRRVILKDNWWIQDNGPLLGYLVDNQQPVAILPVSSKRYELFNPTTGLRELLTEDNIADISPQAFMFYRPFPDKVLQIKDLLKFSVQDCKKELAIIPLMGIAGGLVGILTPLLTGAIFSSVIPGAEKNQLFQITLALIFGAIAIALFQITRSIAVLRMEGKMAATVQAAVWDRLIKLPLPFFRRFTSGNLANRAMGIDMIRQYLAGATVTSILGSIFSAFNFLLLFYFSWKLALVASAVVLIASIFTGVSGYCELKYLRPSNELSNVIAGELFQFIAAISKLRIAGAEIRSFSSWAKKFTELKRLAFKTRIISNNMIVFNSVLPIAASIIIFATFAFFLTGSELSTGKYLAFNAAFISFFTGALNLSSTLVASLKIIPIYESATPILQTLPEVDVNKSDPGEINGKIEMSHISFRYKEDGPLILNDVSFEINPGEFVAFVGPSGSGKSTILRLLLGFETPEVGSLLYDGQDLSTLDITAVRRQIGSVLQNGKLISGDIFSNIVGNSLLTIDDAWEAARMAALDEDIKQMPMGMHTIVSEGGSTFSGGQRQRLLIARAIARRPKIIFFDEASSALDNRTQAIVSESLEKLQATRIAIAHRLSTVVNANRIFVIKAGKIIESGSYDELMNLNGTFTEIAKRQIV